MIKWIPVDLCTYVLKENKVGLFKTFLYLKLIASIGYAEYTGELIYDLAKASGKTTRTIKNHLISLNDQGWINITDQIIYIRTLTHVERIINGRYYRKAEFSEIYLKNLREYLFAIFVGRLIINQKYRKVQKKLGRPCQSKYKGKRSYHGKVHPGFFPVANLAISKLLDVSLSSSQRYKNNALKKGFIEIIPTRILSDHTKDQINFARNHYPLSQEKYRMVNGRLVEIGTDLLKSNILLRRFRS